MYRKDDHQEWSGGNACTLFMSTFIHLAGVQVSHGEIKLDLTDRSFKGNDTLMLQSEMADYSSKADSSQCNRSVLNGSLSWLRVR